jgi:diaminopimelate decarboxylase
MGTSVLTVADATTLRYVDETLHMEDVPLDLVARDVDTPCYVYSANTIRRQFERLERALSGVPHRTHFSVKANSNRAILQLLQGLGAGVDIVSGGELHRARQAGFTGRDIVFSGVGKTAPELHAALDASVLFINVESEAELHLVNEVAGQRGQVAPITFRVNPEVTVDSPHEYIRTGEKGHKFGIPFDDVEHVARLALSMPHVRLVGLDMHLGSQLSTFQPYAAALDRIAPMVRSLRALGADAIEYLDIGGGLAVTYDEERPIDLEQFAEGVARATRDLGVLVILEPGRFLVAESGVLLTRVLYRKRSGGKDYIITDAGMNDLIRPSLYDAYHRIEAVTRVAGEVVADVVGPVCESGDFMALDRRMADVASGDLLAVHATGAYGYVMASNYNSRPRPAEVLVDRDRFALVTERERIEDLVRREQTVLQWRSA